ncbi:hypothetical protein ACFL6U_03970 [Planctomycetota bacterium]
MGTLISGRGKRPRGPGIWNTSDHVLLPWQQHMTIMVPADPSDTGATLIEFDILTIKHTHGIRSHWSNLFAL